LLENTDGVLYPWLVYSPATDKEDNFNDLTEKPMAIIEKTYFKFQFSITDCERLLDTTIGIVT